MSLRETADPKDFQAQWDSCLPFQLEQRHMRGRLVRLDTVVTEIINSHDYPPLINALLAEALALCTALASLLKFDGVFTLQISSDGPIKNLVADITEDYGLRGYCGFDAQALASLDQAAEVPLSALTGKGYLAFTVRHKNQREPYQGIVSLDRPTLSECLGYYFDQSEQTKTMLKVTTQAPPPFGGPWRVAALLLQQIPMVAPPSEIVLTPTDDPAENWTHCQMLFETCTEAELLSGDLSGEALLYRLFHEEELVAYPPHTVHKTCRCDIEKIAKVLSSLPVEEQESLKEQGSIVVTCEFCSKAFTIDDDLLQSFGRKQ